VVYSRQGGIRNRAVANSLFSRLRRGRRDEARTPRAPAKGFALCTPTRTRRLDLASARRDEARTPRAPAKGFALCTPISTRLLDLATARVVIGDCCMLEGDAKLFK